MSEPQSDHALPDGFRLCECGHVRFAHAPDDVDHACGLGACVECACRLFSADQFGRSEQS